MTDPGVKLVREWLQRQPFSLRILTLLVFINEAVKDEFRQAVKNCVLRNLLDWWAVQDSNLRPPACKAGALTS
jgi:hypothetical protein